MVAHLSIRSSIIAKSSFLLCIDFRTFCNVPDLFYFQILNDLDKLKYIYYFENLGNFRRLHQSNTFL